MSFKVKDSEDQKFYFTYEGGNHEPMFTSETLIAKQSALESIKSIHTVIGNQWINAANEAINKSRKKVLSKKDVLKILGKVQVQPEIHDETVRKPYGIDEDGTEFNVE